MIYNEIVHLDSDNKILIEVLDGRSIRLTFEVHPLNIILDKRRITGINIGDIPYLSIDDCNKVFVTINERLHTYDILEIDKVNDTCFMAHTMPRTKSSFFITPMIGESRIYFRWNNYFVNTFITEDKKVAVLYRFFNSDDYKKFEFGIMKHPLFDKMIDYDTQHVVFQFKIPDNCLEDYNKFTEGKYSRMSDKYKEYILKFHSLDKDSTLGKILFKSAVRKKQLELDLGSFIPADVELYDKPSENEYLKI